MLEIFVTVGLYLTYAILAIAVLSAIIFPIIQLVEDPKKVKNTLIGILGLAIIFLISYFISSGEVSESMTNAGASTGVSKMVGGSLIMLYIMLISAIGVAIYSEIAKFFK